jgi:hypothetical protein
MIADQSGDLLLRSLGELQSRAERRDLPPSTILRCRTTDDHELLARAWQAENEKARELGWIV